MANMTDVASLRMVICLYEVRDESLGFEGKRELNQGHYSFLIH